MYENLSLLLDTADKRLAELKAEYEKSLAAKSISLEATQLTHEVCEKLRSALDRVARRYWEIHVAPNLSDEDRAKAIIYFPVVSKVEAFDAVIGKWRWKSIRQDHEEVYRFLEQRQPYHDGQSWLLVLSDIANASKHVDLIPQKRFEERRISVSRSGAGGVSWGAGVTFGGGVSIMGAPIDPRTQRIVPTAGVTETLETWVSFIVEGHNVNALGFCQRAAKEVRLIVTEMSERFGL